MKRKLGLLLATSTLLVVPMVSTPIICGVRATNETTTSQVGETTQENVESGEKEQQNWEEWLKQFFTAERVAFIMTIVAYIGTMLGLVVKIKQMKQSNNLTLKNVETTILNSLDSEVKKEITPYLEKMNEGAKAVKDVLDIFAKILALSQENTSESKVAILELIKQLGTVGEYCEKAEKVIAEQSKEQEIKVKELSEKVDIIIKATDGTQI